MSTNKLKAALETSHAMVNTEQLLPCPFCGGKAEFSETSVKPLMIVGCTNPKCHCGIVAASLAQGRDKWNRRAP